ncbi:hypothetical protein PP175_25275 (plasmid) [Aneurinibacillus sp. Ricciae_BoGa-3]|uniref:hypothetical protein n=1 Tax=Aneurinibacillus sp. Ricciae_BoGa-3 TaxID=3022697 RepID=UPI002341D2DC|nr:hypothetical protein [Aneurinibacillus sp. Ricciae_BoGa-3]WCK57381.1 hypothetical protein PP175_25275 [Aneurinibacillus sp. Ricciae_BoGa-3]
MDIIGEAFGYHSLEQQECKARYEEKRDKDIEEKINQWNRILEQYQKNIQPSHEDLLFMTKQGKFSIDSSLSA